MTILYILKNNPKSLVKQHQDLACSSVLNACYIILFVGVVRHPSRMDDWLVKSFLRRMRGISLHLNTQGVLSSALASIALLTTRWQFSSRHQSLARPGTSQAERVSTSRHTRPTCMGGILDVVAITCNTLAPIACRVGDTARFVNMDCSNESC
jgi:hypothetical protein